MRGSVAKSLRRATFELNEIVHQAHGKRISFRKVKRMYKQLPWNRKGELLPRLFRAANQLSVKMAQMEADPSLMAKAKRLVRSMRGGPVLGSLPKESG